MYLTPYRHPICIKRTLLCIVLVLCSYGICAINQTHERKSNYIIIDPQKNIEDQFVVENGYYVINSNVSANVLKVPNGSTIAFQGGSITCKEIHLNDTYLEGRVRIIYNGKSKGYLKGTLCNDHIYTKWFEGYDDLFDLINHIIDDNRSNKTIHVEKGNYFVQKQLLIDNKNELSFDFGGARFFDGVNSYNKVLNCPNSMIWIRASSNICLSFFEYTTSKQRLFTDNGVSVILIGSYVQDWDKDTYNITVEKIKGIGNLILNTNSGLSKNGFITVLGNVYNVNISNIQYDGDLSYCVNVEYGFRPLKKSQYQKKYNINLPDYYGVHPYNIVVQNVLGRNAPNCTGFLRMSSSYNVIFENCYGYNVNNFVYLYNGDDSINRVNGSAIVRNCVSYINDDYEGQTLAGLSIFHTYSNPTTKIEHNDEINHHMSFVIENCEFQGLLRLGKNGYGIRVSGGDGQTLFKNVTIKNYALGAKLSGAYPRKKVGGLAFNNCSFLNNKSSMELYTITDVQIVGCIFKTGYNHTTNTSVDNQIYMESETDNIFISNCYFEYLTPNSQASFISSTWKAGSNTTINNCTFVGNNVYALRLPTKIVDKNSVGFNIR